MRDLPGGAELLRLARGVLLEELLGELPQSRRYDVLLIASAMAIAAREIEAGEGSEAERGDLEALLGPAPEDEVAVALKALNERLAAEIRAGKRDGDAQTHALLSRNTTARLEISNPKILAADNS